MNHSHSHAEAFHLMTYTEAFHLMTYTADDGSEAELIWNSRDGVTPFVIRLRSGKTASHTNWGQDRYKPDYIPPVGTRVFVDLTRERALEMAKKNLEYYKSNPELIELYREDNCPWPTAEELADDYLQPGAPDLIEVTEEWRRDLLGG